MSFDINKAHVVGNLPFTSGQGRAPVAIPILLAILEKAIPSSINLVQDIGFLTSASNTCTNLKKALYRAGFKEIQFNKQDLFKDSKATVWTADLFCEKGYAGDIRVVNVNGSSYKYDYRNKAVIVNGGSKKLTDFLYNQLTLTKKYGVLLCTEEQTGVTIKRGGKINVDSSLISETIRAGYVPFLFKMAKNGDIIKYIDKDVISKSKDHDSYRVAFGYLPSGKSHSLSIGLSTIVPPGVYMIDSPNKYFVAENKKHAESINTYIQSNPIDKFVLQTTRKNKTFDAKTENGVTKFIPKLPVTVTIKNDEDVFDFLEASESIRKEIRDNYKY